jgi:DNA-binding FadR family transcriptional regulator
VTPRSGKGSKPAVARKPTRQPEQDTTSDRATGEQVASPRRPSGGTTKAAELASRIRRLILVDGLRPGDPLPSEAELITQYGLSRATVREAIRILDAEGFVEVRIGRTGGIFVASPNPDALGEWLATQLALRAATVHTLVEFRRVVEPVAARLAAQRATPEQIKLLHQAVNVPTLEEEVDFHLHVADASQNELLRLLLRAVHIGLREHLAYRPALSETAVAAGRRAHRLLFEAIADRDPDKAESVMRKHMEAGEQILRKSGRLHEPLITGSSWQEAVTTDKGSRQGP